MGDERTPVSVAYAVLGEGRQRGLTLLSLPIADELAAHAAFEAEIAANSPTRAVVLRVQWCGGGVTPEMAVRSAASGCRFEEDEFLGEAGGTGISAWVVSRYEITED